MKESQKEWPTSGEAKPKQDYLCEWCAERYQLTKKVSRGARFCSKECLQKEYNEARRLRREAERLTACVQRGEFHPDYSDHEYHMAIQVRADLNIKNAAPDYVRLLLTKPWTKLHAISKTE